MNIYLDIDGVLLTKDLKTANYAPEFLKYILKNYPDSIYWLTTRCAGDSSKVLRQLEPYFDQETINLIKQIKPTKWETSAKTDAIDFSKPFLWFDDNLFLKDKEVLEEKGVLENWIRVDLREDPNQLVKLLQSFPIPINSVMLNS